MLSDVEIEDAIIKRNFGYIVKIDPPKGFEQRDIARNRMQEWCKENCSLYAAVTSTWAWFEDYDDALLFLLRWR